MNRAAKTLDRSKMDSDLSTDELRILRTMWSLKALGARAIGMGDLVMRLPIALKNEISTRLERLENRGLIVKMKNAKDDLLSLSPLGVAFVRQIQDGQLGDMIRAV